MLWLWKRPVIYQSLAPETAHLAPRQARHQKATGKCAATCPHARERPLGAQGTVVHRAAPTAARAPCLRAVLLAPRAPCRHLHRRVAFLHRTNDGMYCQQRLSTFRLALAWPWLVLSRQGLRIALEDCGGWKALLLRCVGPTTSSTFRLVKRSSSADPCKFLCRYLAVRVSGCHISVCVCLFMVVRYCLKSLPGGVFLYLVSKTPGGAVCCTPRFGGRIHINRCSPSRKQSAGDRRRH